MTSTQELYWEGVLCAVLQAALHNPPTRKRSAANPGCRLHSYALAWCAPHMSAIKMATWWNKRHTHVGASAHVTPYATTQQSRQLSGRQDSTADSSLNMPVVIRPVSMEIKRTWPDRLWTAVSKRRYANTTQVYDIRFVPNSACNASRPGPAHLVASSTSAVLGNCQSSKLQTSGEGRIMETHGCRIRLLYNMQRQPIRNPSTACTT